MERSAVLLLDLQHDFLGADGARRPVGRSRAATIINLANLILGKRVLPLAIPILVVNQFSARDHVGNFFRRHAAVAGTSGAEIDGRIHGAAGVKRIGKARPSAFSNPELDHELKAQNIRTLYVMGVFAEGCVRVTVLDALARGFEVTVLADGVGSDTEWKRRFGLWSMVRAGAKITHAPVPLAVPA